MFSNICSQIPALDLDRCYIKFSFKSHMLLSQEEGESIFFFYMLLFVVVRLMDILGKKRGI